MLSPTQNSVTKDAGHHQRPRESFQTRDGVVVGSSNLLMYAAQQGNVDRVRQLIREQRPLLFEKDRTGKTPLHYCCTSDKKRSAQIADYLVMAAPELAESKDEDGFTPLHLAVIAGNIPLVTFLLANNADVNAVDNERHTVVHWAAVCGETEALRAVLAAGAKVSTPDVHKGFPLHYAAQMCGGNERDASLGFQVLQTLLTHSDIDVKVEDGDGRQPLLWAASAGSAKAVLSLIRAGSPVEAADKDGLTALHCAASRGHTDCIDTLLTLCGASPDVIDSNGCTALHYAVTLGHADATALLLAHGSDPNRQDRKGRSPAHCGCSKGQFETVKMIGSHGANLWLKNARGDLPLHEAAASGRRDLVKWLLAMRPSQVNARNNDGRCPLHLAALNDNADMCKILLDAGAQINPVLRTSKNVFMTPLDCALRRGFRSTAKYIQLHGGVPASRLGSGQQLNVNSAVSLQIRDDITFWGDTSSDSERENGEFNKHVKSQRKKLSQKFERKRASASGSDLDDKLSGKLEKNRTGRKYSEKSRFSKQRVRTDSASSSYDPSYFPKRSSRSKFDYSNEITINGNTEINIHQTREISVSREGNRLSPEEESTRKLVDDQRLKIDTATEKERQQRPKSAKHAIVSKANKSDSERSSRSKSSASSSRSKIRSEKRDRRIDRELKDQATNTANQIEEAKSAKFDNASLAVQPKISDRVSRISDTSEDQEKQEDIIVEASVHEPPRSIADIASKVEEEVELQPQEVEAVNGISNVEQGAEKLEAIDGDDIEDEGSEQKQQVLQDGLEEKNIEELSREKDEDNIAVSTKAEPEVSDEVPEIRENGSESIIKDSEKAEAEDTSDIKRQKKTDNLKRILSHETFLRNQEPETNSNDTNGSAKASININIEQEISVKVLADEQKNETEQAGEFDGDNTPRNRTEETSQSTDILNSADTTVREISEDQVQAKAVKVEEASEHSNSQKEDSLTQAFGEVVSDLSPSATIERVTKKEEKETPTSIDDSTTSSINDSKTHKSFTVLEEIDEQNETKLESSRPKLKKQRSKSEENKPSKGKASIKPSKIPTALGKTILSKSDRYLNEIDATESSNLDRKIPSLPNMNEGKIRTRDPYRSQSNISTRRMTSIFSDDKGSGSEDLEEARRISSRRRRTKRRSHRRDSRSAGSDYESSNVIDSGFEPSPRSTRMPKWKNMSERGVNMTSVTQSIQSNIRRFHLERKIFQHLLDLKRMQIRSGQHNEAMLVKRAIDAYHSSCASTVGAGRYVPKDLSFKAFEKFLYDSLRKLQKSGADYLRGLPEAPSNPLLCTRSTHRCMHATHAYTGVPCAAYLPKLDHHTIPKIGFNNCKPGTGFLPNINPKKAVTLELCHGNDKQVISLPADRLDQNKRYYVTFTVKGNEPHSATSEASNSHPAHRHSRSD
ncbi:hypothetical protein HHI36_000146 [Cryptolaemus montrouzieri]|uniref:Uncharacterized protein n=1 Tax=Cryptolaemus montrouzieri TaxID=559131 RepID=A0ABD2P432_9CUCU